MVGEFAPGPEAAVTAAVGLKAFNMAAVIIFQLLAANIAADGSTIAGTVFLSIKKREKQLKEGSGFSVWVRICLKNYSRSRNKLSESDLTPLIDFVSILLLFNNSLFSGILSCRERSIRK